MDIVTLAIYNAWITVTLTIGFAAVSAARRGPAHVLWWTAGNAARAIASLVLGLVSPPLVPLEPRPRIWP